jgi:hypothetical protein
MSRFGEMARRTGMARIDGWLGKDDPLGGKGQLAPRRQYHSSKARNG